MLDAAAYNLVPPEEITVCEFCGGRYMPDRQFVSFDDSSDGDISAGLIETLDDRAGVAAYRARNAAGDGRTTTLVVGKKAIRACLDAGMRQSEVARLLGVSRARVAQMLAEDECPF